MTLHESIELILQESGRSMTSREIADIINKRKLYIRRDGNAVSASQITSRVGNYEQIFTKEYGKIKLLKDDLVSLEFQKYRNMLAHSSDRGHHKSISSRITLLVDTLENLLNDNNFKLNSNFVYEPIAQYDKDLENQRNKLKVGYRLCNWFFEQDRNTRGVFSAQLALIVSGLDWFSNKHNRINVDFNGIHHFLFKIVSENPDSTFKINLGDHLEQSRRDSHLFDVNLRVSQLINQGNHNHFLSIDQVTTGIIIPPFGIRSKNEVPIEFERIISEIESSYSKLDRAILIVPSGVLTSRKQSYVEARSKLINSKALESVVSFPNGMMEHTAINTSMLLFNFKDRNDTVFFYNATENLFEDIYKAIIRINRKEELKDFSKKLFIDEIEPTYSSLDPKQYCFNPKEIEVKEGFKKYSIGKLITLDKSGIRFKNRNSLYPGGEYKLIRTSEIDKQSLYFEPKESMLGIDYDELDSAGKHLVKGGIVVSAFNKKIKASILSKEDTFALGQDVYWIQPDESLVLEEYLVQELYQPYVTRQVEYFSKGTTISRLVKGDFLKIQIQIPSLELQKDFLVKEFRKTENTSQEENISNKELDFIKTLKHSLKQPASSIGNDLSSLRTFIDGKIKNGETLDSQETIVPLFDGETPEQIEIHRLSNTLDRMGRAITDIDYILQQAMLIITAGSNPIKENIELKAFLNNFKTENPEISINITGPKTEILADRKQLRILINNFLDNAKRHGFKESPEKPIIWMEVRSKDALSIQISIRNNGKSLPPQFTIEDLLAKGASTKADVGSGFGGFLIGQILKNHKGKVELVKSPQFGILPHNVEFLITLPK